MATGMAERLESAALTVLMVLCIAAESVSCPTEQCECRDNDDILCSRKSLDRIPEFQRDTTTVYEELDLSQNEIYSVPPFAFQGLLVKAIDLSRNPLIGVSPRGFDGLENVLEKLHLDDTDLSVIHWGVFRNLVELCELTMEHNGMFAIPKGLFTPMVHLTVLSLAGNKIDSLHRADFANLHELQKLDLQSNRIYNIQQDAFGDLRKLAELNLNNNYLTFVNPLAFSGLVSVETLYLENNVISDIPVSGFEQLPSVKHLFLNQNNLSYIRANTFGPHNAMLEEVSLNQNSLLNISTYAFFGLRTLKILHLEDNHLKMIGDECDLHGMNSIQEITVQKNPIDCTCKIAWLERLINRGVTVRGGCATPSDIQGVGFDRLDFIPCKNESHCA